MRNAAMLILLTVAAALAGCGFHLRGSTADGGERSISSVRIDDRTRAAPAEGWLGGGTDELSRTLAETLATAGIRTDASVTMPSNGANAAVQASAALAAESGSSAAAIPTIELLSETLQKRVASITASAAAAEYQIDYTLRFRVVGSDGAVLVADTTLKADRSYRYKADAIMGSADEEAMLQRDIRRDMASQILRRLRAATLPQRTQEPAQTSTPDSAPNARLP